MVTDGNQILGSEHTIVCIEVEIQSFMCEAYMML